MIVMKRFSDFSVGVRRQLRGLTFREDSAMKIVLRDEPNVRCWVKFRGRKVVSWGLMSETYWFPKLTYMCFTRRAERDKGYGGEVFEAAKEWKETHYDDVTVMWFQTTSVAAKKFFDGRIM